MATKKADAKKEETQSQGRAVILPNGERRVDFIRRRYYDENATRSEIKNEINEMLPEGESIAYQIVFAATKTKDKPVPKAQTAEE